MADKTTVPWDWELLTSVIVNQVILQMCEYTGMLGDVSKYGTISVVEQQQLNYTDAIF